METTTRVQQTGTPDLYGRSVEFRVLGAVEYLEGGRAENLGSPKQRAVLALLLVGDGEIVSSDRLIRGVWGEDASGSERNSLHTYISNLRAILGGRIDRAGNGYRLDVERDQVDSHLFEELVGRAQSTLTANPAEAAQTLRGALAMWRGRPYADLADIPGLQDEIRRLEELRMLAVESRIDADLAAGRHGAIVGELEALAEEHPLREGLRARHMLALYRDGRQAEALRAYQRTREYLGDELGVEPSPELQKIEDSILRHDPVLMSSQDVRTEDLAFLYTDVEGSTVLWETRPEAMREALTLHDQILIESIESAGGRVFKHTGDGAIAAFSSASSAAGASVAAQKKLGAANWGAIGHLKVRMSIDAGEVESRGGDYFGPPLNRGARLMDAAHGGQIVVSADAQARLMQQVGLRFKNLGEHRFKGLGAPQTVFQLVDPDLTDDFPDLRVSAVTAEAERQFGDSIRGYEIRERIGVGRFAVVYRAYQASVGREVAVKVIRPEYANHPGFVRRFESEARLVAKLEHPHIVSLYDFWRDPDGAYLVMPWLSGRSLAGATFGAMSLTQLLPIVQQVGSALAYAHRQGVVHRDVKPANLLVDADGNVYVADFGIAVRSLENVVGPPSASQVYRAPEDRAGEAVDERTDVYSLAAVVVELLTGTAPPDVDRSLLPDNVVPLIDRAMHESPADRYRTVDEFVDALRAAAGQPGETAPRLPFAIRNPYKGLAAFDEADTADFFGRDAELASLLQLVEQHRLTTVVGPSGSGKSSLVRAGLVPALRQGRLTGSRDWLIVTTIPGAHPFDELATALLDVATESLGDVAAELRSDAHGLMRMSKRLTRELDTQLVVVIDQFEELYSLVSDDETRTLFIESLVEATQDPKSSIRVVATIRADFFDHPLLHDRLGDIVSTAHLALSVPGPEALKLAIERPADRAGLVLEDGLAEQIVRDVRDEPGGLPLMQFALTALTDAATSAELALADYQAVGAVTGAVAERASAVYEGLDGAARRAAQGIFLRLVSVSEDADDVRRRVRRTELESAAADPAAAERALDAFVEARLLTFDSDPITRGPTVEVAHEALLREWDLLRQWITDRREALLARRRLDLALAEWHHADRRDDALPVGNRLVQLERVGDDTTIRLSDEEREFLDAAVARREHERRRRRRLRRLVTSGFATAALVATFFAVQAAQRASEARAATELEITSRIASQAPVVFEADPQLGLLLAVESFNRDENPVTLGALQRVLVGSRGFLGYVGEDVEYRDLEWIDDEQFLAAAHTGLRLLGVDGTATDLGFAGGAHVIALTSDRTVAAVASGGDVQTIRLPDGQPFGPPLPHPGVQSMAFSADGTTLATGDRDGYVRLWNPATGEELAEPRLAHEEDEFADFGIGIEDYLGPLSHRTDTFRIGTAEISFDEDGTRLVTAGMVVARAWDLDSLELIDEVLLRQSSGTEEFPTAALELRQTTSDEPVVIATNGVVLQWMPGSGDDPTPVAAFDNVTEMGLTESVTDVVIADDLALFAPEGGRLIGGDIDAGDRRLRLDSRLGGQARIALSPNGTRVAHAGDGGIALLSLSGEGPISATAAGVRNEETTVSNNAEVAVSGTGSPARRFSAEAGRLVERPASEDQTYAWLVQYGESLFGWTETTDPFVLSRLDRRDLRPIRTYEMVTPRNTIFGFAVHPSGLVAGGGAGAAVEVFAESGGAPIAVFDDPDEIIASIAFSPDGQRIAAAGVNGAAWVWDLATGLPVEPYPLAAGGGQVMILSYHPSGDWLVTLNREGSIQVRDAQTLQPVGSAMEGGAGVQATGSYGPYFQDNGRYMITAAEGPGRLWDLEQRTQIGGIFPSDPASVGGASTDGRWLATFTQGDLVLWDLDTTTWAEKACRAAGRNLTEDEWSQFIGTTDTYRGTCPMWESAAAEGDTP